MGVASLATLWVTVALALFAACGAVETSTAAVTHTNRPVVGVLTLPNFFNEWSDKRSYFPASYVKWLEAGGMRVVPIPFTDSHEDIEEKFQSLNGILFTGGGAWFLNHTTKDGQLTQFAAAGNLLFNLVVGANKAGRYTPLWATCLGFELLVFLASGQNKTVLQRTYNALDLPLALNLTPGATQSRMLSGASASVLTTLQTTNSTFNDHTRGSDPTVFASNSNLTSTFRVLSTNKGRDGHPFVSTIEGVELPLYGSQWHPEKVQFEWNPKEAIPHDEAAVLANGYFSAFFGAEARKNAASFPSPSAAEEALIYQFNPVYTGNSTMFTQCYFFD